ncbi:MAG: hypothetical protein IT440_02280 [Phycisphaeraceae bacterium]|nr:hypothetical protein [Phycisphaeraceae bacterium]
MAMWLYQLSQTNWSPNRYRIEIWESERWHWEVGNKSGHGTEPVQGDTVVFFYAPSGGSDPGFYGWAVVLEWCSGSPGELYFRPTAPSDTLKMYPWWDNEAEKIANKIRGNMPQRTLWLIDEETVPQLRHGIATWLACSSDKHAM